MQGNHLSKLNEKLEKDLAKKTTRMEALETLAEKQNNKIVREHVKIKPPVTTAVPLFFSRFRCFS